MTARLPVLAGEDPEIFRQQVEGIVDSLAPRNPLEVALAEQAALALWKIERGERVEAARANATVRAAEAQAEVLQQEQLHALGRWLMACTVKAKRAAAEELLPFLPEDRRAPFLAGRGEPMVILLRIQATAEGCRWLLDRWDHLRATLEQDGCWDIEAMIEAAQLQGQRPLYVETAEWECLTSERQVNSNPALMEEGRRQLLDQLTDGQAADPAGTAAALLNLVEQETARLEELETAHREREALERSELADRLAVDATPEGERVRRYQLDCDRKLHRSIQSLLKLRREGGIAADPDAEVPPGPAGPIEPANGLATVATDVPVRATIPSGAVEPTLRLVPMATDVPVAASGPVEPENSPMPMATDVPMAMSGPVEPESSLTPMATDLPAMAGATAGAIEPGHDGEGDREAAWDPAVPPAAAADDESGPRNEPSPAVGGDRSPRNEPSGAGWISAVSVPALACALVLLLAVRLPVAAAGPAAGATGRSGWNARGMRCSFVPGGDRRAAPPQERDGTRGRDEAAGASAAEAANLEPPERICHTEVRSWTGPWSIVPRGPSATGPARRRRPRPAGSPIDNARTKERTPMSLSNAEVAKVALLARLRLSPEELETFTGQLNSIVDYVAQLQEVDTAGVEPLAHGVEMRNVFRDDVRGEPLPREQALANAPRKNATSFLVPAVLE